MLLASGKSDENGPGLGGSASEPRLECADSDGVGAAAGAEAIVVSAAGAVGGISLAGDAIDCPPLALGRLSGAGLGRGTCGGLSIINH